MEQARQTLDDLLNDPMVKLIMARDGWRGEEVRWLVERVHSTSADIDAIPPAHVIASCSQPFCVCA